MLLLVSPSPKQKVAAAHEACKDSQVWQCSDLFTLPQKKKKHLHVGCQLIVHKFKCRADSKGWDY